MPTARAGRPASRRPRCIRRSGWSGSPRRPAAGTPRRRRRGIRPAHRPAAGRRQRGAAAQPTGPDAVAHRPPRAAGAARSPLSRSSVTSRLSPPELVWSPAMLLDLIARTGRCDARRMTTTARLRDELGDRLVLAGRRALRPHADGLERHGRPAAADDRPLRRRRRRRRSDPAGPRTRPGDRRPLRRAQRAGDLGAGRRPDDRPDADGRGHGRPGHPAGPCAGRRPARRAGRRGAAARPRHHRRQRLAHRRRRAHARRRHGLARSSVRPEPATTSCPTRW